MSDTTAAGQSPENDAPGLHACVGCGVELDGDDPNDRCDDCPIPPAGTDR